MPHLQERLQLTTRSIIPLLEIVQVGAISGKFESVGEFHAVEGDVLYAAPMTWHQMSAEAASGPSVRLAMGGYPLINMNNTEAR